jgi:CrcB protein
VIVLCVIIGAMVGAPARYVVDLLVQSRHRGRMPWGTVTVNVAGSLVLGLVAGAVSAGGGPPWVLALVGTGFCGALTTFSTFSFATFGLLEDGEPLAALANVLISVAAGLIACSGGYALAVALVGAG